MSTLPSLLARDIARLENALVGVSAAERQSVQERLSVLRGCQRLLTLGLALSQAVDDCGFDEIEAANEMYKAALASDLPSG